MPESPPPKPICGPVAALRSPLAGWCVTPGWYVAGMKSGIGKMPEMRRVVGDRRDAQRVVEAHAALGAALVGVLDLVAELDADEAYLANAATDMVSWLTFDLGVAPGTARRWMRVGRRLPEFPLLREALAAGVVSFDEVAVLVRFATPETEAALLELTRQVPQAELAAAIKEHLEMSAPEEQPAELVADRPAAELRMWWEENDLQVRGRIRGVDGLLVETALLRYGAKAPVDPTTGLFRDPDVRQGEALVQLASEATRSDGDPDRATVVVHVTADELRDPDCAIRIGGKTMQRDEWLRLTCDGRIQPAIDDPTGFTIGVGRTTRRIPPWLSRLVTGRDRGCRFPGCGRTRWTHAHHIIHWANDGPTNLDNLLTLCGFHHRLIHSEGWTITGHPSGDLVFRNQWGSIHQPARPRFHPGHIQHLLNNIENYRQRRHLALANAPP